MKYKLLAVDLDGTLLTDNKTISDANRAAMTRALDAGIRIVYITGRSVTSTYPVYDDFSADELSVCFGGAIINNMRTHKPFYQINIASELVTEALLLADELGIHAQIYVDDYTVYKKRCARCERYETVLHIKGYEDKDILNKSWDDIPKVLYFVTPEEIASVLQRVRDRFDGRLAVSTSGNNLIEINNVNTSKADGLIRVCEHYGIALKETIAMGDSLLDLPMLCAAGMGFAMRNSTPELLEYACNTAPSNEEDAVAYIINNYMLS